MRFIFYAVFILFALFCIIIAVSNGETVNFSLNPLPINIELPSFMLVFLGIFIGLFGGWLVSISTSLRHARRQRLDGKKIKDLEKELKSLKPLKNDFTKSE